MKTAITVFVMLAGQLATAQVAQTVKPVKPAKQQQWRRFAAPTWVESSSKGAFTGGLVNLFGGMWDAAEREDRQALSFGTGKYVGAPTVPDTMGAVTITSVPTGATVKMFGTVIGQTPLKTRLAPGHYTAIASAAGYANSEATLEIAPNANAEFEVTLTPLEPNSKPDRQPDSGVVTLQ